MIEVLFISITAGVPLMMGLMIATEIDDGGNAVVSEDQAHSARYSPKPRGTWKPSPCSIRPG